MNNSLLGYDLETPGISFPQPLRPPAPGTARGAARAGAEGGADSLAFGALFHAIESLRTDDRAVVLQFVGADAACRTDRIASGLARTARQAIDPAGGGREGPILYVDATGRLPPAGADLLACLRRGEDFLHAAAPTDDLGIAWAGFGRAVALAGDEVRRMLDAIRTRFALAVIDCGPAAEGRFVPPLARHCDGTVLVAEADRTRTASIAAARTAIERAGGRLLGAVMNGGAVRMPRWLETRV